MRFGINYDIEWEIIKVVTTESPQPYRYKIYGELKDLEKIKVILPFTGDYDVSVVINDLHNNKSKNYMNRLLQIKSLTPDFIGMYKEPYREMTITTEANKTVNQLNSEVRRPYGGGVAIQDVNITIESFNQNNYANPNEFDRLDNYYVSNLVNATINDTHHLTPDNTQFSKIANWVTVNDLPYPVQSFGTLIINDFMLRTLFSDLPTSFVMFNFNNTDDTEPSATYTEQGNNIRIKNKSSDRTFNYGFVDTTNMTEVDALLAALRSFYTDYEFNPLYKYDSNQIEIGLDRITVTGLIVADSLDCEIEYWTSKKNGVKFNNMDLLGFNKGRSYMVNMDITELNTLYSHKTFPNYFQITWCSDNSKIPGKNGYYWTLINNSTGKVWENDDQYFTHFFKETGEYSLELKLKDTNGNVSSINKVGLIKII